MIIEIIWSCYDGGFGTEVSCRWAWEKIFFLQS